MKAYKVIRDAIERLQRKLNSPVINLETEWEDDSAMNDYCVSCKHWLDNDCGNCLVVSTKTNFKPRNNNESI